MKDILIKYYRGHALTIEEALQIITEYMQKIEINNPDLIKWIISPTNPFSQGMLQHAVSISAKYLATIYTIVRVTDKDNKLLMVF